MINESSDKVWLALVLITFSAFFFSGRLSAQNPENLPDALKLEVFSSHNTVKPGQEFELGVLFNLSEGWHIYWKNPGESGLPTKLEPTSSNIGLRFAEVNWPVPIVFNQPGNIPGQGYKEKVLFKIPATLAKNSSSKEVEIEIFISWLLCSESVCIPGRTSRSLTLKIASQPVKSKSIKLLQSGSWVYPEMITPSNSQRTKVRRLADRSGEFDKLYELSKEWNQNPGETESFIFSKPRSLAAEILDLEILEGTAKVKIGVKGNPHSAEVDGQVEVLLVPKPESGVLPASIRFRVDSDDNLQ